MNKWSVWLRPAIASTQQTRRPSWRVCVGDFLRDQQWLVAGDLAGEVRDRSGATRRAVVSIATSVALACVTLGAAAYWLVYRPFF